MNKKILVIDDSSVMRMSVQHALMSAGYDVEMANNGKEGLITLKKLKEANSVPELIFVDINMPVMDGITFIRKVKQTSCKTIPVLVLTTESEERKRNEGRQAGAAGWLVKPFDRDKLIKVVRKFVR